MLAKYIPNEFLILRVITIATGLCYNFSDFFGSSFLIFFGLGGVYYISGITYWLDYAMVSILVPQFLAPIFLSHGDVVKIRECVC